MAVLWLFRDEDHMNLLEDETANLEEVGVKDEDSLLVEIRSRDGTWPEEITSLYDRRTSTFLNAGLVSVK